MSQNYKERHLSQSLLCLAGFCLFLLTSSLFPQERFRRLAPPPDPLDELKLPLIQTERLSNGLAVTVVQQDSLPFFSLRLIIHTGESSSPENRPGLATFAANMLDKGTSSLSALDIEEEIESIGGSFITALYPDHSIFSFSVNEEHLDRGLELLGQMILNPAFPRVEIESVKRTMYYDLVGRYSDPEYLGKKLLFQILFSDHPYQRTAYSDGVIRNLSQQDLLEFFDTYYRPNNAELVIIGNLNMSTATRKVSHYLGVWRKKNISFRALEPPVPQQKQRICFVNVAGSKDATIYIGNIFVPTSEKDFFPFLVLNQVIGGTPNSRLFMNLRETKGYAYWAFSAVEFFKACGLFYLKIKVRPEVTYAAIQESLNEIRKITEERISSFEIEQAKSYLIGNFPLELETYEKLSLKVSEIQAFNLGEEHWSRYYENIMVINSQSVFDIARRSPLLTPLIVIVGDNNVLADHLQEFEEVEVYHTDGTFLYTWKGESQ